MRTNFLQDARDYNRSLWAPIRAAHAAAAIVRTPLDPVWRWLTVPSRRLWAPALAVSAALVYLLLPVDQAIIEAARALPLGGDVKRELSALQQYGQFTVTVLGMLIVLRLDPANRRRLLDWGAAIALAAAIGYAAKIIIGRPRPKFDDPLAFLGPFGQYPVSAEVGVRHAWELWAGISSDLWSMPSSHTLYAVVMSVALTAMYPRLKPIMVFLACLVGVARVLFNAHYVTDVIAGAALGYVITAHCMELRLGQRFAERMGWIKGLEPRVAAAAADRAPAGRAAESVEPGGAVRPKVAADS